MNAFRLEVNQPSLKGRLRYSHKEGLALTYDSTEPLVKASAPRGELGVGRTLTITYIAESGRLLYLDGYCPINSWKEGAVDAPSAKEGKVLASLEKEEIVPGVTIPLDGLEESDLIFDRNSGWARIGTGGSEHNIEVANDIVIGMTKDKITTVWLHPTIDPNDAEGDKKQSWWRG